MKGLFEQLEEDNILPYDPVPKVNRKDPFCLNRDNPMDWIKEELERIWEKQMLYERKVIWRSILKTNK